MEGMGPKKLTRVLENMHVMASGKLPYLWNTRRIVAARDIVRHENSIRVRPPVIHSLQLCSKLCGLSVPPSTPPSPLSAPLSHPLADDGDGSGRERFCFMSALL